MKITNIEKQKKNINRSSVFLDGKFAFGIDDFDLFILKLKVGMDISEEQLVNIKETVLLTSAKDYAIELVSRFTYSRKKMIEKLHARDYDDEIINKTLEFLEKYNYINDYDYATRFINDALKIKHIGIIKIKHDLKLKGISDEVIDTVLSEISVDCYEEDNILPLAQKKLAGNFEYKNIMKTKRYLLSKGYTYDLIDDAINKIVNGEGE